VIQISAEGDRVSHNGRNDPYGTLSDQLVGVVFLAGVQTNEFRIDAKASEAEE
jgi:hypothetical protein